MAAKQTGISDDCANTCSSDTHQQPEKLLPAEGTVQTAPPLSDLSRAPAMRSLSSRKEKQLARLLMGVTRSGHVVYYLKACSAQLHQGNPKLRPRSKTGIFLCIGSKLCVNTDWAACSRCA